VLGHLPNSSDSKISAKAALFIGRRVKNPAWVEKQLIREDERLRANAVESFWGTKSESAVRILEECADDSNNRVAGNALIGLHLAGHPAVVIKVVTMAASHDPRRRSAAAWVMGRIGAPEFVDYLKDLIRDADPKVRSTAVRSLGEISRAENRRLEAERAEAELCRLEQLRLEQEKAAEEAAQPEAEAEPLNLPVPGFTLRLDGSYVPGARK
jgi:HEAT repeat protein